MPWPIRSSRLGSASLVPTANAYNNLGTVPTGKKWLVKELVVYSAGAATHTVYFAINAGGTRYHFARLVASTTAVAKEGEQDIVLNAAESLEFVTSSATAIQVTVHGAQLG